MAWTPAATLEGSLSTRMLAVYVKNSYYTIDPASIVPAATATGITAHENKNGGNNLTASLVNSTPHDSHTANSQQFYKLNGADNTETGLGFTPH